jgi:putative ABC transport system permease protein
MAGAERVVWTARGPLRALRAGAERVREAVYIALEQLRANKFRSALTILGIIIGVATVLIMSAVIAGVRGEAIAEVEAVGPTAFIVARYDFTAIQFTDEGPAWDANPRIEISEIEALGRLPAVRRAIIWLGASVDIEGPYGDPVSTSARGRNMGWEEFDTGQFIAGTNFHQGDVVTANQVVILSRAVADGLFRGLDPIGRTLRLNGQPFQVIGVYEPASNIFGEQDNQFVIVPYTSAVRHLNAWLGGVDGMVIPRRHVSQQEAMDQATGLMRSMRGLRPADENNFVLIRQQQALDMFNRITGVFFIVMIGLSSVALLVGGVGVIAIMMISVTERTREIGVRKALGARRREILWQFLFEASTLTVAGAGVGLIIGGGLAWLIRSLSPIPASVQPGAVLAALVMAAIAGVFFGLFPAWRASRLDPVEALRYE